MKFSKISSLFSELSKHSKRITKILLLRDFYYTNPNETILLFDIIAQNYQRSMSKKTLGISIKTLLDVISFVSSTPVKKLETEFNKVGDIGIVAQNNINPSKQNIIGNSVELTLEMILDAYKQISKKTGTNSNKRKKELLSKLFMLANSPNEYLFLTRLLMDDLRIGVSEGVLRDACVQVLFFPLFGIHWFCKECNFLNYSSTHCNKCSIKMSEPKYLPEGYSILDLSPPKHTVSLQEFDLGRKKEELLGYLLRNSDKNTIIEYENPRELYKEFVSLFEKNYYLLNSFCDLFEKIKDNKEELLNPKISLGKPLRSMLGTRAHSVSEAFEMTEKPAFFDYKYDGLRVQIHNNFGEVSLFSRNLENITSQFSEIVEYVKTNFSDVSFVLDSECVGYDFEKQTYLPFQTLSRRILSKNSDAVSHINVVVKLFDILYFKDETLLEKSYKERRDILEGLLLGRTLKQKLHLDVEKILNYIKG